MKTLTSIFVLLTSMSISAQISVHWSNSIGGSAFETSAGILETDENKIIVLGSSASLDFNLSNNIGSSDMVLIQADEFGEIEWIKNYGGSDSDKADDIIKCNDGGYLIAGGTKSIDNQVSTNIGSSDVWIFKINEQGVMEWDLTVGDTLWDDSRKAIQSNEGDFLILSRSQKEETSDDFLLTKVDQQGNLIWNQEYGGSKNELPLTILESIDGYFLIGSSESSDLMVTSNNGEVDYWIIKIDKNGNKLWDKNYGGKGSEVATASIFTEDGNIIVIGRALNIDPSDNNGNYWMIKIDTNGNIIWDKNYGGSEIDNPTQIIELENSDFLITGYSSSIDGDLNSNYGDNDFWILQLSADGNIKNSLSFGGSNSDRLTHIAASGNKILLAGHSSSNDLDIASNNGNTDIWFGELGITTSIFELQQNKEPAVYPNPANHSVNIELSNDEILKTVEFYNIDGQILKKGFSSNLSVSELTTGNYIIRIRTDKGDYHNKIVVKNGM